MRCSSLKKRSTEFNLPTQAVVLVAIAWAIVSLLFFLLFSVSPSDEGRPYWYQIATYVLENGAFLGAAVLCLRNWRSPQIVSGRSVWLALGLGMVSFFIANLFLGYWELILQQEPDVSPGDFFFILMYVFVGAGMFLAVLSRRLSLSIGQWLTVVAIGLAGSGAVYYLYAAPSEPEAEAAATEAAPAADAVVSPAWATAIDQQLAPLADLFALLYVIGDILLVILATMLLMAFWGGRFSQSWRFIAAAAFCFYIADLWFSWAIRYIPNYETGALPEVFWIFSGVLFAIGAALEYDLSTRSRRSSRRRA
ncbi:MAG: hypothetical protein F6K28_28025 [Microcoleus sp. SIO2G3]|nr:hypothetical protein [Microcoleus sp. SIO2G3]